MLNQMTFSENFDYSLPFRMKFQRWSTRSQQKILEKISFSDFLLTVELNFEFYTFLSANSTETCCLIEQSIFFTYLSIFTQATIEKKYEVCIIEEWIKIKRIKTKNVHIFKTLSTLLIRSSKNLYSIIIIESNRAEIFLELLSSCRR